ncbi:glycosyl transferase [Actinoplanes sp. ATCC 53533]|uniref:nucleotide disphospho-sugar-binding domain-containing protein n=1 Tax=Actinoplanes sp. ATCC 53533 TaxID=1288362 RepID=UPI000F78E150|nr:nucleotide disphospho-sugar-binding domain-containing protein [Actinoplanes sp. ATCC 53533]RSM47487.1 glycosyl transferase [Actinoplanes sp. ATCC 53533]
MRIMFPIWPNPSHLYPIVPLAWSLQSAGHEVCVPAHPDIADATTAVGLTAVPLGDAARLPTPMGPGRPYVTERAAVAKTTEALGIAADEQEAWDSFSQFMLPAMWDFHPYGASPSQPQPVMDELVEFARAWKPDLVLWDPCFPGAAVAARAAGAIQARFITAPDYWVYSIDLMAGRAGELTAADARDPMLETMAPVAERHGVELDAELLRGQFTITPLPEAMRLAVDTPTESVRWIPYSQQTPSPDWLYPVPERPRVAISLGLSWRRYLEGGWNHIPALLNAVSELDVEVVATLNAKQLAQVDSVPPNVRAVDYLPLNQLVPTCRTLIHHGGFASFAAAAATGVPQLVTDSPEAAVNAVAEDGEAMGATKHAASPVTVRHVTARHAGEVLDIGRPSAQAIQEQVARMLTDRAYAAGAATLRADYLAAPDPHEVVAGLERRVA